VDKLAAQKSLDQDSNTAAAGSVLPRFRLLCLTEDCGFPNAFSRVIVKFAA